PAQPPAEQGRPPGPAVGSREEPARERQLRGDRRAEPQPGPQLRHVTRLVALLLLPLAEHLAEAESHAGLHPELAGSRDTGSRQSKDRRENDGQGMGPGESRAEMKPHRDYKATEEAER